MSRGWHDKPAIPNDIVAAKTPVVIALRRSKMPILPRKIGMQFFHFG
jgi:hypothetical protein